MAKRKTPRGVSELHIDGKRFKVPMAVHAFIDQQHRVNDATQQQMGQLVEIIYNIVEETNYEFPTGDKIMAWQHMAKDACKKYGEYLEMAKKQESETPSEQENVEESEHQKA